jgi:hypothetical protein
LVFQGFSVFSRKEFVMDDECLAANAPVAIVQATVVRQFAGSRVERQLLSQVFDLVWLVQGHLVQGHGASRDSSHDHGVTSSRIDDDAIQTAACSEGVSQ